MFKETWYANNEYPMIKIIKDISWKMNFIPSFLISLDLYEYIKYMNKIWMDRKMNGLNNTLFSFIQLATLYEAFIDNDRQFATGN